MSVPTAAELKALLAPEILVSVPGHAFEIVCRRPDIDVMMLTGIIQLPHLQAVLALRDASVAPELDNRPVGVNGVRALEVMDAWCVQSAIRPRLVATEVEAADGHAVFVGLLPLALKIAIVNATKPTTLATDAGHSFRDEPAGGSPGSSGETVQRPPLESAADDGSAARAGS